jgi:F420-0:gamma-glutamyl ligase
MTAQFQVQAFRTEIFNRHDDLHAFLLREVQGHLQDGDILAITSKIVGLAEEQVVDRASIEKLPLVRREADHYLGEIGYGVHLTIKHGLFIPSAGIDESNVDGDYYILFPKDPYASAKNIWTFLTHELNLKNLGILITDSHTMPLRKGVTGIALSYWGFKAVQNRVGEPDIFGRPLKVTQIDIADALAAAAVFAMGESSERRPLARVRGVDAEFTADVEPGELMMPVQDDMYLPIYQHLIEKNQK